jgi:hypothetical protein
LTVYHLDSGGIACFVPAQVNNSLLERAGEVVWDVYFHHAEHGAVFMFCSRRLWM